MSSADSTRIRSYWNHNLHDQTITTHPVGSLEFFEELSAYRFQKLHYLPKTVDFAGYRGKKVLEVGCGLGIDLAQFSQGGAEVVGIDLAENPIRLAREHFRLKGLSGEFYVMDGACMEFDSQSFDMVYAHGVLQYAAEPRKMVEEMYRVLQEGGQGFFMVYNRKSWLSFMAGLTGVEIEHADAPFLRLYSRSEFQDLLSVFPELTMTTERFPVRTQLHGGLKARLYNDIFVRTFRWLPKDWIRSFGWHLLAFTRR